MLVAVGTVRGLSFGSPDMGLMRLTADGMLDPLFDGDGMIAVDFDGTYDEGYAVAIQPDGDIVAAGYSLGSNSNSALLRVNGDGSLDSTFGVGGKSVIDLGGQSFLYSILVRADNSLAATGLRQNFESSDDDDTCALQFRWHARPELCRRWCCNSRLRFWDHRSGLEWLRAHTAGRREISRGGSDGSRSFAVARFDDGSTFPGIIGLIKTGQRIAENTATVAYTVRRTGGSNGSVSVDYATAAGTATTSSDFQDASGTLTWDDGDMSNRIITIDLVDDAMVEPVGGIFIDAICADGWRRACGESSQHGNCQRRRC